MHSLVSLQISFWLDLKLVQNMASTSSAKSCCNRIEAKCKCCPYCGVYKRRDWDLNRHLESCKTKKIEETVAPVVLAPRRTPLPPPTVLTVETDVSDIFINCSLYQVWVLGTKFKICFPKKWPLLFDFRAPGDNNARIRDLSSTVLSARKLLEVLWDARRYGKESVEMPRTLTIQV